MTKQSTRHKNASEKIASPSFVKLAMRNMVRKGSQSLIHFGFTTVGFLALIILIAWLARPNLPQ